MTQQANQNDPHTQDQSTQDQSTQNFSADQEETPPSTQRPPRSLAEWVTFGLASAIVGAIASLVIYAWATERDEPPILTIQQTAPIRKINGQFYIPFELKNTGGKTAESIQIVAELRRDRAIQAAGDLQVDFLSSGETEQGAFVFQQNPQQGELVLRVAGYKQP